MRRFGIIISALLVLVGFHPAGAGAQNLSVSTNVGDWARLGTANFSASCAFARHWSVDTGLRYNPFSYGTDDGKVQSKQRSVSLAGRWWPWHIYSGWWLSGHARYQEFSSGGFESQKTKEGDRYGGGFSAGYAYMLGPHFNLEFGLGMWAGQEKYVTYACPVCGLTVDSGTKVFFLPDNLMLSFAYVF